jgi:serine phosphatase RsbU (regulator of sigma subunit)
MPQLFYLLGWTLIFTFFCFSWGTGFNNSIPLLLILIYFWYRLSDAVISKIKVPFEIWIIGLFLLGKIDNLWNSAILDTEVPFQNIELLPGGIATLLQIFILSVLILLFNFILRQDRKQKPSHFILFMALVYASVYLLGLTDIVFWQIFQFILLLILFRYTTWVESLTKAENWLYLVIIFLLYLSFSTFPTLNSPDFTAKSMVWYYLPKVLAQLFKLYLLAILIKIPFVLVYHHASLKRKFQIAGWLQSTIPQIIQLIILVLVFYFFISGWQANSLKNTLNRKLQKYTQSDLTSIQPIYTFKPDSIARYHKISGYTSFLIPPSAPDMTILKLSRETDPDTSLHSYFLLFESERDSSILYHLLKIDTLFLQELNKGFPHFLSNGLMAYPFTLQSWDSNFYKIRIWQSDWDYKSLNIFPFALTPRKSELNQHAVLKARVPHPEGKSHPGRILIMKQDIYTTGRLFTSLYTPDFKQQGYYAIDMALFLNWDFFKSNIMFLFYFWLIIYFLINLLVIQRVVSFGNQITQKIIQKFNHLTLGIRQISGGNLDYRIKMEGEDEFVELADRFNQMGGELQKNISELRDKDRLEHELRIARDVQLGLLPKTLPEIEGYQITAHMNTATEVGGDFYDMIPLTTGKFLLVIGDVSGKGTSAAFYMAQCISLIRFACQFTDNPQEILLRLNRYFSDPRIDKQIFVTTVIGVLDSKKHQITLLRAGHNHPILISKTGIGRVEEIEIPGLGIGLEREGPLFEKTVKRKVIHLGKGDALFLYTDGLVEASAYVDKDITDRKNVTFFGEDRLIDIINRVQEREAPDLIREINNEVKIFYGQAPLIDDLTMLLVQRERK